jgi:hypothetical protein
MTTSVIHYQAAAQAYVSGVQSLFAPPALASDERGGRRRPDAELVEQARLIHDQSTRLTLAATEQIAGDLPAMREQASIALFAKALTDLEIGAYLLDTAGDAEPGSSHAPGAGTERSAALPRDVEAHLALVLGATEPRFGASERRALPTTIPAARALLANEIEDALALILERSARLGQAALSGLLGVGLAEIGQAASIVGMDLARAFGWAEQVNRLYGLFRDFVASAYDALAGLLGPALVQAGAQQVVAWMDELSQGKLFGELLEKLYETQQTSQVLMRMVAETEANVEKFVSAAQRVSGLSERHRVQVELGEKLLKRVRFLGVIPAVLPQGRLILAMIYILASAYIVLAGADYVDAPRLKLLNRSPGMRQVVAEQLT